MNDYQLINSLLEDGSEQSILKLKIIVNFDKICYIDIKEENFIKFVNIFKDKFDHVFSVCPEIIKVIHNGCKVEIVKMFKQDFDKLFSEQPHLINLFCEYQVEEILTICKKAFTEGFKKHPWSRLKLSCIYSKKVEKIIFNLSLPANW